MSSVFDMTNENMLRRELVSRIEKLVGAKVKSYRRVEGGYTPALRLLCETNNESFFVKIGVTPGTSESLNREIRIYDCLSGDFMLHLIAWENHESESILIIEDLYLMCDSF
jgi:hypothetical protein